MNLLLLAVFALPLAAKELRVAADGSGDFRKLSKALDAAKPGDVVLIKKPVGMVGAELKKEGDQVVIVRVVPGSPAEAAGMKAGARLLKIDGAPVTGTLPEVVARVRGPVGSQVSFTLDSGEMVVTRGQMRYEVKDDASKLSIAQAEQDVELAHELAEPLAEAGVLHAQTTLAFNYVNGFGVKKNLKKGFYWAQKAAEAGSAGAQRVLANFYHVDFPERIQPADPARFVYWIRKAAEGGDAPAMLNMALMHEKGYQQLKQDFAAALDWARRADASPYADTNVRSQAQVVIARLEPLVPEAPKPAAAVAAPAAPSVEAPRRDELADLPPARASDPKAVAVVIGVERHREALPRAPFAAADARLAAEYYKRLLGVSDENLALLVDDRATKSDFEKYFEQWLPNHVEADSKVYVYFSGHGAPDPAKGDSYLVPYDADPVYIKQTGYPLKRLYAALAKLPTKRVIVAIDSCFSGSGGRSVIAKGARPLVSVKTDAPPAGVTLVSASTADQISSTYEDKGHGLFTYFLLKGLRERNGDFKAAFEYLAPEVARTARRRYNADQTPQWRQAP